MSSDTIYAFASGAGRAAIGVFRLSGPGCGRAVEALAGRLPVPRHASLVGFADPATGDMLDRGLLLWFPGPASFTGEDAAECHIHGGPAVAAAFVRAFAGLGLRPADPGEFTRRAFLNGKLDLSAAEGLADLIDAETETQRRQALRIAGGSLREAAAGWRAALLEAAALIEGEIDFADEADVPKEVFDRLAGVLDPVRAKLAEALAFAAAGERIRDGISVVIAGPPNAGKSTLLNALARREVAIVSEHAGTTRDVLEVHLNLGGLAVTLADTAGLRDSFDPVEKIGVERARTRAQQADLTLWLSPADAPAKAETGIGTMVWTIGTKADLERNENKDSAVKLSLSALTGDSIPFLLRELENFARAVTSGGETSIIARERHRAAIEMASAALDRIAADRVKPIEFIAEDLRLATRALESLVGRVDAEDVLGEIFSRFCVGK